MRYITCLVSLVFFGILIAYAGDPSVYMVPHETQVQSNNDEPLAGTVRDTQLKLIEQGLSKSIAIVRPKDALILLVILKTRIEELLALGNTHPALRKNDPATLEDFDKLFWSMHVFSNQLGSAGRFFDYAQGLKATAKKYKPKANDKTDLTVLQTDWDKIKTDMTLLREKFILRDRELRVARLTLADKVLTESKDVAERLLAALALDMDGEILPVLLAKDATFPATQTQTVKDTISHARTVVGREFLQKSRWLFTGLHWWVRGRYGLGTSGEGLMKDPAAVKSPDAMFGLLMPISQPIPTPPGAGEPVPLVDRRHYYLWQFETRQVASGGSSTTTSTKQFVPHTASVTTMTHFY